jgi:hypothetical protein
MSTNTRKSPLSLGEGHGVRVHPASFPVSDDGKNAPILQWSTTFQGRTMHPCKHLKFWYWWGDTLFDIRNIRLHFGKPSQLESDITEPMSEKFFLDRMQEVKRLVGRNDFTTIIEASENIDR